MPGIAAPSRCSILLWHHVFSGALLWYIHGATAFPPTRLEFSTQKMRCLQRVIYSKIYRDRFSLSIRTDWVNLFVKNEWINCQHSESTRKYMSLWAIISCSALKLHCFAHRGIWQRGCCLSPLNGWSKNQHDRSYCNPSTEHVDLNFA